MPIEYRVAGTADLAELAAMRWDFRLEESGGAAAHDRASFLTVCHEFLQRKLVEGAWAYWIAIADGQSRNVAVVRDLNSCAWSADSRWIACVKGNSQYILPGVQFGNLSPSALVLISSSGGDVIELTDASALNHSPAWSSDSRRLYFVSNRDGPRDLYVMDLDKSGRPRRTPSRVSTLDR